MIDVVSDLYYEVKVLVEKQMDLGNSLEKTISLGQNSILETQKKLDSLVGCCLSGKVAFDDWKEIAEDIYNSGTIIKVAPAHIPHDYKKNDFKPSNIKGTAWYCYKNKLINEKHFLKKAVDSIEKSSNEIVNQMSLNDNSEVVKGLVVGNVQSGKTANMAGVIAQAADEGWNLFVVLSGTIENLRDQTQKRLLNDLFGASSVEWSGVPKIDPSPGWEKRLSLLTFEEGAHARYINVCLKNSTRLQNLLCWLNQDAKTREKIRLVIIDDEADQASVNAKNKPKNLSPEEEAEWNERTKINLLLTYLLTNKDEFGNEAKSKFKSLNYIAYTATPYANVLNEKESPESTYPANFISTLETSDAYFGPQTIFGIQGEFDGLPIINNVSDDDTCKAMYSDSYNEVAHLKKLYKGETTILPRELKKAILWFYCCFAIRKKNCYKGPVSMLIHATQITDYHDLLAESIEEWFQQYGDDFAAFVNDCEEVYREQVSQFPLKCLWKTIKNYPYKVSDYPSFESFKKELVQIFQKGIKHVYIDESGKITFNHGVHLCIDNCRHSGVENTSEHIRLIYPDDNNKADFTTGFIVIGGATLSRGLTIEGLVSTYFLRTIKQADTLMQMGRWFGYRKGYELLPRVWMTKRTQEQFEFLSLLDFKLRENLAKIQKIKIKPSEVGVKILSHPLRRFLQVTSTTKMKDAEEFKTSFNGEQYQTTIFFKEKTILDDNLSKYENFVKSLGKESNKQFLGSKNNCHIWEEVKNNFVIDFLKSLKYPKTNQASIDYDGLSQWIISNKKNNWNVILSGVELKEGKNDKIYSINGINVSLINRSKLKKQSTDDLDKIGVLRNTFDLVADIEVGKLNYDVKVINNKEVGKYRKDAGLINTPVLILYLIDKDSIVLKNVDNGNRIKLDAKQHVVGTYVYVPEDESGDKENYVCIPVEYKDMEEIDLG